jgi:hypothetical protein
MGSTTAQAEPAAQTPSATAVTGIAEMGATESGIEIATESGNVIANGTGRGTGVASGTETVSARGTMMTDGRHGTFLSY